MNWSKEWPVFNQQEKTTIQYTSNNPVVLKEWPKPNAVPNPNTNPEGFVEALGDKLGWSKPKGQYGKFNTEPTSWPNMNDYQKIYEKDQAELLAKQLKYGTGIILTTIENGSIVQKIIDPSEYHNLEPTHDPYTNPNACIYYECACGEILDPGTKSFAQLNNVASNAGWKIRWGHEHYKAYCVECGKDVE